MGHIGKPEWLKVKPGGGARFASVRRKLTHFKLNTVCDEARCPNRGECYGSGTATFMVLGDTCTRNCRFCAVRSGAPRGWLAPGESGRIAEAAGQLGLEYIVLTMVTRDDLDDGGVAHLQNTVAALRRRNPGLAIELLLSDLGGNPRALEAAARIEADVFGHNLETTRAMTPLVRDGRCRYETSLAVLARLGEAGPTKSALLVGLGEEDGQVLETMADLRAVGVRLLAVGQYLQPSADHLPVRRYVPPETFEAYRQAGLELGFAHVAAAPLVRSSYQAAQGFAALNQPH